MVTDHLENTYRNQKDMCKYYGIKIGTFKNRRTLGWSLEEALTLPPVDIRHGNRAIDHLGNAYLNREDMCEHYGIDVGTFYSRIGSGRTIEEALTTPIADVCMRANKPCQDHLGNEFCSIREMCKHYRIKEKAFYMRVRKYGWSLERALIAPGGCYERCGKRKCTDHLGKEYESCQAMCEAWGVDVAKYRNRRHYGWSVERALTTK